MMLTIGIFTATVTMIPLTIQAEEIHVIDSDAGIASNLFENTTKESSFDIDTEIPDKTFQAVLAESLQKNVSEITQADLETVRSIDFSSVPRDTRVDLTGILNMHYLKYLDTLNVDAFFGDETAGGHFSEYTTIRVRAESGILSHFFNQGPFDLIQFGDAQSPTSLDELLGTVKNYMAYRWPNDLVIYGEELTDYSLMNFRDDIVENSLTMINTTYTKENPLALQNLSIVNDHTDIFYSDDLMKDSKGNPILSASSNAAMLPQLVAVDENGVETNLIEGANYQYTGAGVDFIYIPKGTVKINVLAPEHAEKGYNYDLNAVIAVDWSYNDERVTVEYVDEAGNSIHDSMEVIGIFGESYDVTASEYKLAIAGYHLVESKLPENAQGIFNESNQVVTYVYEKEETIPPITPTNPVDKEENHESEVGTIQQEEATPNATTGVKDEENSLPKMGETGLSNVASFITGSLLVGVFIFMKKHFRKENVK